MEGSKIALAARLALGEEAPRGRGSSRGRNPPKSTGSGARGLFPQGRGRGGAAVGVVRAFQTELERGR